MIECSLVEQSNLWTLTEDNRDFSKMAERARMIPIES